MVTVAASHTVPFGAGRQTVYVNWSTPVKPGAGVYVYVPFDENTRLPFDGLLVLLNTEPDGYVSLPFTSAVTGVLYGVVSLSSFASGPTTIVTVAGSHSVPFGAGRHTSYANTSTPVKPAFGL
jgi:hypothetical protein